MMAGHVALAASATGLLWTPSAQLAGPAIFHRGHARRGAVVLQALDDEEGEEEGDDEAFLDEMEAMLQSPGSSIGSTGPGLRIQRALNRRDGRRDAPRPRSRTGPTDGQPRFTRESTQLFRLPATLRGAYDDFLERPGQPLLLGSLSMLVGFYLAGSLSTIFGAKGFWEPTVALGPLTVTELISRRYYSRPLSERSQTIRLLNAAKVGFYLGIVIDALKLAG